MSSAEFFVIGATHQNAPLEMRERLALDAASKAQFHAEMAALPGMREAALLATCNRVEFYCVASQSDAETLLQSAFCRRQNFDEAAFGQARLRLSGRKALLHLLEVAAGLDSQMVGENEIFGQVKDAYAAALERKTTGPVLNRVFQKVFQAAKHVRTNTGISMGQVSVASVAVDLALDVFGSLSTARVLLVGAGDIGEKTARAFQSRGAPSLTVTSRTQERAAALAASLGAAAIPFAEAPARLADFDIVVCATAAPHAVVPAAAVTAAMRKRPAKPLLLVDMGLPRDVEPEVSRLQNVYLFNLDDLAAIAERNRGAREAEIVRCRAILAEKADALWRQIEGRLEADGTHLDSAQL